MWAAQALKDDFAVSLLAIGPIDLAHLNLFYGTKIGLAEVSIRSLPIPRLLARNRAPAALRGALGRRALKHFVDSHDLLISTYNLCDFGVPAIHFIADFSWDEELRRASDPAPGGVHGMFHRLRWLRRYYLQLCTAIAPPSGRDLFVGEDLIVANSQWTAAKLSDRYNVPPLVVYPPVAGVFPDVSRARRKNDFACLGRIAPEKRVERLIQIIGAVRKRGHDARIRIIGPLDASPYARTISALAHRHREWVLLEGRKVGAEKVHILANCRYGIHGREGEAFGIAVAEMVKAGCVTFAPSEGGPAEILDHEALLYRNDEEAVEKITAVMEHEKWDQELCCHLRRQAANFSPEIFIARLREVIEQFLSRRCVQNETQRFRKAGYRA
jgi:glycosyltransferase involved in cell wall biosynthesis